MMKLKKSVMFEFVLSGEVGWKIQEEEQNVRRGPWGDVEVTKDRSLLQAVECEMEDIERESLYNNSRELRKNKHWRRDVWLGIGSVKKPQEV